MITGEIPHKKFNFPAGEMHVSLDKGAAAKYWESVCVTWDFKSNDEIIELLLYCNALKEDGHKLGTLTIPYFPFSRQDRVAVPGDAFSLKVMCELINSLEARKVVVYDAHSDVLPALLNNLYVVKQEEIFYPYINQIFLSSYEKSDIVLISPDAGALKKTYKVAAACVGKPDVVCCNKQRNPKTGDITGTEVLASRGYLDGKTCIIVDDICDGGRTFTEIAKTIKAEQRPYKIILMVTHGLFTKGLKVFDGLIDEIYTRNGRHVASNLLSNLERRAV